MNGSLFPADDGSDYPSTVWIDIQAAASSQEVLHRLVESYMHRIARHARVKWGRTLGSDLEDTINDFLVRLLRGHVFGSATRGRGRFRSYLLACFDNHIRDTLRRRRIEPEDIELVEFSRADESGDLWAEELFQAAWGNLQAFCEEHGHPDIAEAAYLQLVAPLEAGGTRLSGQELAARLGTRTPNAAYGKTRTATKWFEKQVEQLIRSCCQDDEDEVQAELAEFVTCLARRMRSVELPSAGVEGFLDSHLSCDLPDFDHARWEAMASVFARTDGRLDTYHDLLIHAQPPVELLILVKRFAKSAIANRDGAICRDAALLLYYLSAALAANLYDRQITRLSPQSLSHELSKLLKRGRYEDPLKARISEQVRLLDEGSPR